MSKHAIYITQQERVTFGVRTFIALVINMRYKIPNLMISFNKNGIMVIKTTQIEVPLTGTELTKQSL